MQRWNEEQECFEYIELTHSQRQRQNTAAAESTWVCQSLDWLGLDWLEPDATNETGGVSRLAEASRVVATP